ncbi:MAG TPA: serine/threonine-protein kinase [Burkholderiales bacterium]|nr:serine/threonine-protein kinase [Burkholderiales bacterium]
MSEAAISQLGRYKIVAELGRGAMGVVYRGEDSMLNRPVAIKTIILSANPDERKEYEARFYQEAKAAGGLNHPNVITIHDIGREGDTVYMAMELLEGVDLRGLMKQGRVALPLALELVAQAADGLAYAHEHGVVHRDIKPANVMVVRGRHAKIMDFGIARLRVSDVQTQTGAVLGSPKYMSPEQVTGLRADHRSDVFSLGIVLYEVACGAPPFAAGTVTGLMHSIATATQPPPTSVDGSLPSMLDLIVARALEKEPDARYQGAAEMASDLRACLAQLGAAATAAPAALAPAPAQAEKTVQVAPIGDTVKLAPEATLASEATRIAAGAAERSRRSDSASGTRVAAAGVTPLYMSRKFDSGAAMQQLTAVAATGAQTATAPPRNAIPGMLRRLWNDAERRLFAVTLIVATALAALIALV